MSQTTTQPRAAADEQTDAGDAIQRWTADFLSAVVSGDPARIANHFTPEGSVRDLLAFSWDFRNAIGREEIGALLTAGTTPPASISVKAGSTPTLSADAGARSISTFLSFDAEAGSGDGFLRLVETEPDVWLADSLLLSLATLKSHPEQLGENRPIGRSHGPLPDRRTWHEQVDADFEQQDPAVVIVGSGHSGLMLAARLRVLGVRTLIVERNDRVGDNWRKRYSSLALHTPLASDQLPYIPYPPTWTKFTPKDKYGDFLESYAKLLDLTVWTGTQIETAAYDEQGHRWKLDVVRPDGSRRTLVPGHLVFATGMNGEPFLPDFPGREKFDGTVIHAVGYRGHAEWAGKKAVVVGTGVSGHDLAQDLAEHGVDVTMIQRSGTVVMNTSTFHTVMHANHVGGEFTTEEADLLNAAAPFGQLPSFGGAQLDAAKKLDGTLLDSLTRAGFKLSEGPDGQGVLGLIFGNNATGYYYNAGASELIADGTIKLRHGGVTGFDERGVTLDDGTTVEADLVVFATGYRGATTAVREVLGDAIADDLGEFAHVGVDREYGRLWRHSGHDRLWMMISLGIGDGRFYSKLLALQIAAMEAGD